MTQRSSLFVWALVSEELTQGRCCLLQSHAGGAELGTLNSVIGDFLCAADERHFGWKQLGEMAGLAEITGLSSSVPCLQGRPKAAGI